MKVKWCVSALRFIFGIYFYFFFGSKMSVIGTSFNNENSLFVHVESANASVKDTRPPPKCGEASHPKVPCFDESVRSRLTFFDGDTIPLHCIIHNANDKAVTWTKDGLDMPISVDTTRFLPDNRIQVQHSYPEEWSLIIQNANVQDDGVYRCQINLYEIKEKKFTVSIRKRLYHLSNNQNLSRTDRKQNDQPNNSEVNTLINNKKSRVSLTGPSAIVLGSNHVTLTCKAQFVSRNAKLNEQACVRWWHRGVQKSSSVKLGLDISMSWKEDGLLVSLLIIEAVTAEHSGRWICSKSPSETPGEIESAEHELNVLGVGQPNTIVAEKVKSVPSNGAAKFCSNCCPNLFIMFVIFELTTFRVSLL